MILKNYQKKAVDDLLVQSRKLLAKDEGKVCVFKAPTGSGKTIMVADYLMQFAKEYLETSYSFIWISSNDLHSQSKEKLERYLQSTSYSLTYLEDVNSASFAENEIVFVNWHSLTKKDRDTGEWSNVLMRDNENDRNLKEYIRNTKEEGRKIILIVDESHNHYWSNQSQELVKDVIGPQLTVEVSATPKLCPTGEDVAAGNAGFVSVRYEDVVEEGMIKSEIVVNKEIEEYKSLESSTDDVLLDAAIAKRKELESVAEGFRICQKCSQCFERYGGDYVIEILPAKTGIEVNYKWFCYNHRPNFLLSLGHYSPTFKNPDNIFFVRNFKNDGFQITNNQPNQ